MTETSGAMANAIRLLFGDSTLRLFARVCAAVVVKLFDSYKLSIYSGRRYFNYVHPAVCQRVVTCIVADFNTYSVEIRGRFSFSTLPTHVHTSST